MVLHVKELTKKKGKKGYLLGQKCGKIEMFSIRRIDNGEKWRSSKKFNDDIPNQPVYAGSDFLMSVLRN